MTAVSPATVAAAPAPGGTVLALHSSGAELGVGLRWLDRSGNEVPVTGLAEISIFEAP